MRFFIVPGHRVVTGGDFTLNDLSGSTGRLDILLRCVNSAFFLSNSIRQDVELYLVLLGQPEPPKTVKFVGSELRYLNPDERSTAALVRSALMKRCEGEWARSTPGIYVARKGFDEILAECAGRAGEIFHLREGGQDMRDAEFAAADNAFVLGDQYDLTAGEEEAVARFKNRALSLGQKSMHTDHCITIVNNALDRACR
jgi:tRNA (pseudouridine54-N1)-methyltransferase